MSKINITDLSFAYDNSPDDVFAHVTFLLDTDWKLGFTGRNGRGKTTFLNLLQGKYEYTGEIQASVRFEYFPYEVMEEEQNTIDILKEIAPDAMEWEIDRELSLLEVREDVLYRSFATLSKGEQTKALLAALFLKENCFLLIDEPTNHLDVKGREALGRYLNKKKGFILVSHDKALLDLCVDHILSINKTNIEIQKGNFSSWWENKRLQDQFEIRQNDKLKKDIHRLSAAAQRNAAWSDQVEGSKFGVKNSGSKIDRGYVGHKAAKMMKRSKAVQVRQQAALEEKSKLLHNIENEEKLAMFPLKYHSHNLGELKNVSLSYDGKTVCENVSFSINQGDRISLSGRNGSGKSSLLKVLLGDMISCQGDVRLGAGLKISYVSQDTSHLQGTLSEYAKGLGIEEHIFKSVLRKMDFEREQFEKDISNYSQGQKKKVLIAGSLCEKAHLYIWDEPLNFVDVISRIQIEEVLLEYQPTLLFVEHDISFSRHVATAVVSL